MTEVVKDGVKMAVQDGNHLAAFLNNGWVMVGSELSQGNNKANMEAAERVAEETSGTVTTEDSEKKYTKSEIQRMSTADLKALAPNLGIEVTEESTGAKLKEEIIAKLGL